MPIYVWRHKPTQELVEIIRSFDNYQDLPTLDEVPDELKKKLGKKPTIKEADWEKYLGGSSHIILKWPSSGGSGKGYW